MYVSVCVVWSQLFAQKSEPVILQNVSFSGYENRDDQCVLETFLLFQNNA